MLLTYPKLDQGGHWGNNNGNIKIVTSSEIYGAMYQLIDILVSMEIITRPDGFFIPKCVMVHC